MAGKEKIIAVIGVSEEDTAHLRLLMRKASERLQNHWKWAGEEGADLIVVDPNTFAGQLARVRISASGSRCAVLVNADWVDSAPLILRRPLKLQNFLEVMAQAEGNAIGGLELVPISDDFYFSQMGEFRPETSLADIDRLADDLDDSGERVMPRGNSPVEHGLDEMLKHDPAEDTPHFQIPSHVTRDTRIEAVDGPTRRSENRRLDTIDALAPVSTRIDPNAVPPFKRAPVDEPRGQPLRDYLTGTLLGGPARLEMNGVPALILDPKHSNFHTRGSLPELKPYFRTPILRSAWMPVTSGDFGSLRETQHARPYEQLIWLDTLVRGNGHLASHLDPGGTYRLNRRLPVAMEFPIQGKIAEAMQDYRRLNEIAADSGASMPEVFDTVTAYDAIGCIEWQPRRPRHVEEVKRGGLLGKLRLPFGKK